MRCGYFDCFSGAAGDMILAAMVHAGLAVETLHDVVRRLRLPGVTVHAEPVRRGGFAATHVKIEVGPEARKHHRHLPDILALIDGAGLSAGVTARARQVFTRLAEAEATVHGIPVEKVHFHEVGAADAIVDIVGACAGVEALGLETITCSPIPTGSGTVQCEHGTLPVPAPATAELLRGVPLAACDEPGELTTPTGAAVLTTLAESFGPLPAMRMTSIGCGAGTRENRSRPNVLRLLIGEQSQTLPDEEDRVVVLETQLDDATGQTIAFAIARLLAAGALDAFALPIVMKKGRPGQLLTVLCAREAVPALEDVLFGETTTFGIRQFECLRHKLAREHVSVQTRFGPIRVKVGRRGTQVVQAWPEFEDCAAAAHEKGVPLRTVQDAALREWTERYGDQHDRRDG
jgi:pyridinium-3,5-bisthiocarboxylic acid mononucleotide nickel chelatase